jgi:predicted dinucleotide-binding enzyme
MTAASSAWRHEHIRSHHGETGMHSAALAGKIIVDIANPLDATYTGLTLEPATSAAPMGAIVVKRA